MCSTNSFAPASTACAAAPIRTPPPAPRWTSAKPATSSASCSTCSAATARASRRCSARPWPPTAGSTWAAPRALPRPQRATVLPAARAPMPTGWRPSATTTSAIASRWTPTPPTGGRWRASTWRTGRASARRRPRRQRGLSCWRRRCRSSSPRPSSKPWARRPRDPRSSPASKTCPGACSGCLPMRNRSKPISSATARRMRMRAPNRKRRAPAAPGAMTAMPPWGAMDESRRFCRLFRQWQNHAERATDPRAAAARTARVGGQACAPPFRHRPPGQRHLPPPRGRRLRGGGGVRPAAGADARIRASHHAQRAPVAGRTLPGRGLGAGRGLQGQRSAQDRSLAPPASRRDRRARAQTRTRALPRGRLRGRRGHQRSAPPARADDAARARPRRSGPGRRLADPARTALRVRAATAWRKAAMRPAMKPLKPLDEALAELLAQARPLPATDQVSTLDADGRVLAQDCISALQVPAQDNSAMDGYAVRCADVTAPGSVLPVAQRITAGSACAALPPGSAARIFTGAPMPAGADAIVLQEDCQALAVERQTPSGSAQTPSGSGQTSPDHGLGQVQINARPQPGQWLRHAGEDIRRGAVVLTAGTRLTPATLGLAASIGLDRLQVARRPRVALFSTGDELVMPGTVPPGQMRPGAIYNSNRFFLRALLLRLACEVSDLGIVPDQREATEQALQAASAAHDLILTRGGVSVGEEAHVKPAVQALGRLDLWQIAIKPGKPFASRRAAAAPL